MLDRKIINYKELIDKSTKGFVGRGWVRDAVDDFLSSKDPRHFLLMGEPGSGKTAFMADLVRRREYPHHFIGKGSQISVTASLEWRNPVRFAESIGYQLVRDYGGWIMNWDDWGINVSQEVKDLKGLLVGAEVEQFQASPRPADSPKLTIEQEVEQFGPAARMIGVFIDKLIMDAEQIVQQLLTTPLRTIAERWPERQLVLVVDGLDEAEDYSTPQRNILKLLPTGSLPANVRFLLSSRPGQHLTSDFLSQVQRFWLSEDEQGQRDPHTLKDAQSYVMKLTEEGAIGQMLALRNIKPAVFSQQVAGASRGNFLYLHHYAQGVREGDDTLLNLAALPKGLYGIYQDFLGKIKERRQDVSWDHAYKPVLGTLAVAQEPLTRNQIVNFSGVRKGTVGTILVQVKQFLDVIGTGNDRYYAVYHTSFGEYLISEENEDYIDGLEAHSLIADYYIQFWSGVDGELPDFQNWESLDFNGGYGLRHLVHHLERAGRWEELHSLVTTGQQHLQWAELRRAAEGSYEGYLSDLEAAWRCAEEHLDLLSYNDLVRLIQYALIKSSIHSLAENISPPLLLALVKNGIWTPQAGLANARLISDSEQRLEVLSKLIPYLKQERQQVVKEVVKALPQVSSIAQARVLTLLIPHVPEPETRDILQRAQSAVERVGNDNEKTEALVALLPYLSEGERNDVLEQALQNTTVMHYEDRFKSIVTLLPHLPKEKRRQVLNKSLMEAQEDKSGWEDWGGLRALRLATLANHLPESERLPVLNKAQQALKHTLEANPGRYSADFGDWLEFVSEREETQDALALCFAELEGPDKSLEVAQQIWERLLEDFLEPKVAEGVNIDDFFNRDRILKRLIAHTKTITTIICNLPEHERLFVLEETRSKIEPLEKYRHARTEMLCTLSEYYPETERLSLLQATFQLALAINDTLTQVEALIALAASVPDHERASILQPVFNKVKNANDHSYQADLLSLLARVLTEDMFLEALNIIRGMWDEENRARVLTILAPRLPQTFLEKALEDEIDTWLYYEYETEEGELEGTSIPDQIDVLRVLSSSFSKDKRLELLLLELLYWENFHLNHRFKTIPYEDVKSLATRLLDAGYSAKNIIEDIRPWFQGGDEWIDLLAEILFNPLGHYKDVDEAAGLVIEAMEARIKNKRPWSDYRRENAIFAKMAPYLPEPLLQKAIKVTHLIRDPISQLLALVVLGKHLLEEEDSGIVQEALDVLRSVVASSGRIIDYHIFAEIASHFPSSSFREAIEIARMSKHSDDHAQVIITVFACYLPENERPMLLQETFEYWHGIHPHSMDLFRKLIQLSPRLSSPMLVKAVTTMIGELTYTIEAVREPVIHLAKTGYPDEALSLLREISSFQNAVMVELIQLLPLRLLQEVLESTRATRNVDSIYKLRVLVTLYFRDELVAQHQDILDEVLKELQTISSRSSKIEVIEFAPFLPLDHRQTLLFDTLTWILEIDNTQQRSRYLSRLAEQWVQLPYPAAYVLWNTLLRANSMRSRFDLLLDLIALEDVIITLPGEETGDAIIEAIIDVGRWYP